MNRGKCKTTALSVSSLLVVLALWSGLTYGGLVEPFFLPSPSATARAFVYMLLRQELLLDIWISTLRVVAAFAIATMLAVPFGMLVGLNKTWEAIIEPIVGLVRYLPTPALIPLFVLWFGIGETEKIIVIAQCVFFQLVLMVASTVAHTPREIVDSARTLGANRRQIVTNVIFAYCKPEIFDHLRVSIGWAWSVLMMAEIVGATSGLGLSIIQSQRLLQTPNVIVAVLVVGAIGLLTDLLFKKTYGVLFPWSLKLQRRHA